MALSYASNIQRKLSIFFSFQKCNLSVSCMMFITSAKEVMFLPEFVCLSAC